MLAQIELDYYSSEGVKTLSREVYEKLRKSVLFLPEWKEGEDEIPYFYDKSTVIDLETDGQALIQAGISFKITRFKGNYFADKAFELARQYTRSEIPSGSAIHVHIPNIGLLKIDEVDWMEDACTEDLQCRLDEGWRILAVCPPAMQRRPDYILGRTRSKV